MNDGMACPICRQDVISDANAQKYCSLCGMNMNSFKGITVKRKNRKFNFCCLECKNKFLKIGFRSFNMFRDLNSRQKYGML